MSTEQKLGVAVALAACVAWATGGLEAFVAPHISSSSASAVFLGRAGTDSGVGADSGEGWRTAAGVSSLLAAGIVAVGTRCALSAKAAPRSSKPSVVAVRAEVDPDQVGAYKMSKAVPFLPVSPALEGYVGEEDGFDPMGFSLAFDIRWLREAELKHARVAMLATVGWITTDLGVRVPGEPFANVSTLEAHNAMIKFGSMQQLVLWLGFFEIFGFLAINKMCEGETDRAPGDFGIRTWYPKDPAGQYEMQLKELRNGRLAMLAFSGIVTVAAFTGKTWPFLSALPEREQQPGAKGGALCGSRATASAPRAAAVSCAAKPVSRSLPFLPKPKNLDGWVGCEAEFDPLGFSETFDIKWLREAEIKHGRVSMLATVGFVVQQWACEGPNKLAGLPTQPDQVKVLSDPFVLGQLGVVIAVAGWLESGSNNGKMTMLDMFEDPNREPGNLHFGEKFLDGKDEEYINDMKLKELNNGRLAMFAWLGMIHHNFVVDGPLFPLVPEGWKGPQHTWAYENDSAFAQANEYVEVLCKAGLGGADKFSCLT